MNWEIDSADKPSRSPASITSQARPHRLAPWMHLWTNWPSYRRPALDRHLSDRFVISSAPVTTFAPADFSAAFHTSPKVETSPLSDGGLMIVELETGGCWQLNRVGSELWDLFQQGSSLDAAVATLAARYEVGRDTLLKDLQALVTDLCGHGLLLPAKTE